MSSAAFCISLSDSDDRQARFSWSARRVGQAFEWWVAVDGRNASREDLERRAGVVPIRWERRDRAGLLMSPEVGCALSHRSLWEHGLSNGLDSLVIFEDDTALVRRVDPRMSAGVDIVYLNEGMHGNEAGEPWGMIGAALYAYIVSRRGMERLLDIVDVIDMPIDLQVMSQIESLVQFGHPMTALRREGKSLLTARVSSGTCWYDRSCRSTINPRKKTTNRFIANFRRILSRLP